MNRYTYGFPFLLIIIGFQLLHGQQLQHPRGLVTQAELPEIRSRLSSEPYATFLKRLVRRVEMETAREPDSLFLNPVSRGLTRAMLLQQAAIIYDFCYTGWSETKRKTVNEALFPVILSTSSNMGRQELGILHDFRFWPKGGFASSEGSCLGVNDHQRRTTVSYEAKTGSRGAFIIQET